MKKTCALRRKVLIYEYKTALNDCFLTNQIYAKLVAVLKCGSD